MQPNLNNLTKYTRILHGNHHNRQTLNAKNLLLLKKKEFDIFYSTKYKYPLLVAETITALTGKTDPNEPPIDRRIIEDPFRQDLDIPSKDQYTLDDYKKYMAYGGSMGHNAPAGQHKTNMTVYNETFVLTNITPQEMVFNSGIWVLIENWCRNLGRNSKLEKIMVFTGSIPDKRDKEYNGFVMNVPSSMFKIICINIPNRPDMTTVEIFQCDNKAHGVNYNLPRVDLSSYLVPHNQIPEFQLASGVDIKRLLEHYGFNSNKIKPFRAHLNMDIYLNPGLKMQMKKSKWFGKLIYARTLDNLEYQWAECQKFANQFGANFGDVQYHREYYELTKQRLEKDNKQLTATTPKDYSLPTRASTTSARKNKTKSSKKKKQKQSAIKSNRKMSPMNKLSKKNLSK